MVASMARPLRRLVKGAAGVAVREAADKAAKKERADRKAAEARRTAREAGRMPATPPGGYKNLDTMLKTSSWGLDSMASCHISGNKAVFNSLRKCTPIQVQMADGGLVTADQMGSVTLRVNKSNGGHALVRVTIDNVYFHERFAANLLSLQGLHALGWELHSTKAGTEATTPNGNLIRCSTRGRVTIMEGAAPERVYAAQEIKEPEHTIESQGGGGRAGKVSELVLLHSTLGHMGADAMMRLVAAGTLLNLPRIGEDRVVVAQATRIIRACKVCAETKGNRTAFGHLGVDRGTAVGETLHMDTYQVPMTDLTGRKWLEYGLVVKDPYSGYRWQTSLKSKDEGAQQVINVVRNAQTQLRCKVKRLYADGGTEFINATLKEFCSKEGIELHYPPARTQQLNGVAERTVRTEKEAVRAMMNGSGAPRRFWRNAAAHSVYVWNRSHVSVDTKKTPYELVFGKKTSTKHWGVFGCDAFVHVAKEQRGGALGNKMEACVYAGHDQVQNCAVVWVLRLNKMVRSRDVVYRKESFTHLAAMEAGRAAVDRVTEQDWSGMEEDADDDEDETVSQGGSSSSSSPPLPALSQSPQDEEWEVKSIVGKRDLGQGAGVEYKVRWSGYGNEADSWEPEENLTNAADEVEDWNDKEDDKKLMSGLGGDGDSAAVERVHMVMGVMQCMQGTDEREDGEAVEKLKHHVAAAISILEQAQKKVTETPNSYNDAVSSKRGDEWRRSMEKEMASCEAQKVWTEVDRGTLPVGANVLPCKWVYKVKNDENDRETELKARITPKGFRQKEGVDFFEVYASTGQYKTKRICLALTALWDHELDQMDVPSAFLFADLEEDVYMEIPEGYRAGREGKVFKLLKSVYGLKQAPRNWSLLFRGFLTGAMKMRATVSDPCLYYKRSRSGRLILMFVFVDDVQGSYHLQDGTEWNELKAMLTQRFNIKDLGASKWILGMRITRDRGAKTITLDQELYVTKALVRYGLTECKVATTPGLVGGSAGEGGADSQQAAADAGGRRGAVDRDRFMEITGTCIYAAISTRPDIAYATNKLASKMSAPTKEDMVAAERVLRYLAGTRDIGLVFGAHHSGVTGTSKGRNTQLEVGVCAYADADWANDKETRRSVTGWVAKLGGDPISWASKKQRIVALSTCEAELYAEAAAIQEVLWLRGLLGELGLHSSTGSTVFGDNQSAIAVSKNGVKGERTKHVDIKYHFVTEHVTNGQVQLQWVPSREMEADIFTKALGQPLFEELRKKLMSR